MVISSKHDYTVTEDQLFLNSWLILPSFVYFDCVLSVGIVYIDVILSIGLDLLKEQKKLSSHEYVWLLIHNND